MGYLGEEARTAEVIDKQGWLHTGDVGKIDEVCVISYLCHYSSPPYCTLKCVQIIILWSMDIHVAITKIGFMPARLSPWTRKMIVSDELLTPVTQVLLCLCYGIHLQ